MRHKVTLSLALVGLIALSPVAAPEDSKDQDAPKVKIPEPGVPQIMTMEGRYVRAAYNNEGYVILGYRLANLSVGEPWMLLEVGITLREGTPSYTLTRDALSLDAPDGRRIPLPSVKEYREADTRSLQAREKVQ